MREEPNAYSRQWFECFHQNIGEARTVRETAFICHCAPQPQFTMLADLCCGMGRHARALSSRGYSVTGVDRDADVIATARELAGGPRYVHADVRDYQAESGSFDIAILMSQSFGHFDATTNRDVLRRLAASVREGGRVLLDLWNPGFFATHQGEREFELPGGVVRENKHLEGDRLFVRLDYPDGSQEQFEWQLFSPEQMNVLAQSVGLGLLFSCTDFDGASPPSPDKPRIQFLLGR
jgi:SAM-dependent methyltransferase